MSSHVLMIENDSDDRFLTDEVFNGEGLDIDVDFLTGSEVPGYLMHNPAGTHQLIIVAMNANPFNGIDLVRMIRATRGYEHTPIIILSEFSLPEDVQAAYAAGATSFITKPSGYDQSLFKIRTFLNYWFRTVDLPLTPSDLHSS